MNLNTIIAQIEKDAQEEIAKIQTTTDEKVEEIKKEYATKREERAQEVEKMKQEKLHRLKDRTLRVVHRDLQDKLNQEKQVFLSAIFNSAIEHLVNSKKYQEIIEGCLEKCKGLISEGVVIPAKGKEEETVKAIKEVGAQFSTEKGDPEFKGGFVIRSEKVDINASFEAILKEELWEDLEIQLHKLLFA